ncbi:MAG: hypothetical protein CMD58_06430, partial [Gammaproteobacteria bacterium]|nr:hypothetical protein [Gammaproteobacteria bacterium]
LENLNIFSTWSSHNELSHLIEKYKNNEENLNKKNSYKNTFKLIEPNAEKMKLLFEELFKDE